MAAQKDDCYYMDHAVDIAFMELVMKRVDLDSLNKSFQPWFDLTFNEKVYFSGGDVEAPPPEDSADRFNAVLVVVAFAFTPFDPKFGFGDHQLLLKKIFDMKRVWAMMMVVLFGLGEGSVSTWLWSCTGLYFRIYYSCLYRFLTRKTVDRRQIDKLSAHMRGLTGVTSPLMKILYRVAVLQAYQIAAYCFHRSIDTIRSICMPTKKTTVPEYVFPSSFNILRNEMFAFMFDWERGQSVKGAFRKKIQYLIGYDAHCKLLFDSLEKKVPVLANASVKPCGQLKETDGGMDDGLFDTEESDDNVSKNLRPHQYGQSKKLRSTAQASESLPVESMRILTLQGNILSLEGNVSTLQGAVTTLLGTVTTLHGIVSTLEGIMVRFHSVRKNYHTTGNSTLLSCPFFPAVFSLSGRNIGFW